jgi:hypothetical protein
LLDTRQSEGEDGSGEPQRMRLRSFTNRFKNVVAQLAGNFVSFQTEKKGGTIKNSKKVIYSKDKRSYYEIFIKPASNCDQ